MSAIGIALQILIAGSEVSVALSSRFFGEGLERKLGGLPFSWKPKSDGLKMEDHQTQV